MILLTSLVDSIIAVNPDNISFMEEGEYTVYNNPESLPCTRITTSGNNLIRVKESINDIVLKIKEFYGD